MAQLVNEIFIKASPDKVWAILTNLELLSDYDPGVERSEIVSTQKSGLGSARKCSLRPKGWFAEKVVDWQPTERLSFELYDCTLPVKTLRHDYKIRAENGGTKVVQTMNYRLKMGILGQLMDWLMVRKKWDAGIKGFMLGLKNQVETA